MLRSGAKPTLTPLKHTVYLIAVTVLFVLLSFIAHAAVEITYLNWAQAHGHVITWYTFFGFPCALPPYISYGLLMLGLLVGPWIGSAWWRWVYVEGRHWKRLPFHHE